MRVLAISSPSTSHFMPVVPLIWALRSAGHEVMFLGQPDVVGMARSAGLPTVTVGKLFDADQWFRALLPADKRPIEAGVAQIPPNGWRAIGTGWAYNAKDLLGPCLEFARSWRPDLIVTDPLEYSGLIIGGVLGVPAVHHRWSAEPMTAATLGTAKKILQETAQSVGLEEVPDPDVVLDPFPAAMAIPGVPAGRPIRPVPYNGGGSVPSWIRDAPETRRVCVTFGLSTVHLNGLPLVRHIVDGCAGLDAEAVVMLDKESQDQLGPVPANVRLVESAPLKELLDISDAVVHHGGGGTTITALMLGLPHLLLPQIMDQHPRCTQIEATGAAIQLADAESQNDPETIHDALRAILGKPQYRDAALSLREQANELPSTAETARYLENLMGVA
jgi:UDP:flavonoid glycosyltransferase YjiC (YdhE family)